MNNVQISLAIAIWAALLFALTAAAIPTQVKFQGIVRRVTSNVDMTRVKAFVRKFSSYQTRFAASPIGRSSQLWLLDEVMAATGNYSGPVTVREVDHGYLQKSIIAKLEGVDSILKKEVVILGAHLDSMNTTTTTGLSLQPGADDNGGGCAVILETLRALVQSRFRLRRTLEFHWYTAEEIGQIGSNKIASEYRGKSVNVIAMLNMDLVGYHRNGTDTIRVYTDNGNAQLAQFIHLIAEKYLTFGIRNATCNYLCSDYGSWTSAGFPAIMVSEITENPLAHTVNDTIQNINFNQVREFIKIAIGFGVEMAEYQS